MKRSRQLEKENKFEQFKRQQKLHPEFAGIYADAFLATPQEVHFFRELLVFDKKVCVDSIVGVVQIQPHTTMRELRLLLRDEPTWVSQPVGHLWLVPRALYVPRRTLHVGAHGQDCWAALTVRSAFWNSRSWASFVARKSSRFLAVYSRRTSDCRVPTTTKVLSRCLATA